MKLFEIYQLLIENFDDAVNRYLSQGYNSIKINNYINYFKYIRDSNFDEINDKEIKIDIEPSKRKDINNFKNFSDLVKFVDYISTKKPIISKLKKFTDAQKEKLRIDFIKQVKDEKLVNDYFKVYDYLSREEPNLLDEIFGNVNLLNIKNFKDLKWILDEIGYEKIIKIVNTDYVKKNKVDIDFFGENFQKLLDDENFIIYVTNNPEGCVTVKNSLQGSYTWCIAAGTGNQFYNYMLRNGVKNRVIYIVVDKKYTEKEFEGLEKGQKKSSPFNYPWHTFVVQVDGVPHRPETYRYYITDANNQQENYYTKNEIIHKISEKFKDEKYFEYLIPNELDSVIRSNIEYIQDNYRNIDLDTFKSFSYEIKNLYLSMLPRFFGSSIPVLSLDFFRALPDDLKNNYISYDYKINDAIYAIIIFNPKLRKNLSNLAIRKLKKIINHYEKNPEEYNVIILNNYLYNSINDEKQKKNYFDLLLTKKFAYDFLFYDYKYIKLYNNDNNIESVSTKPSNLIKDLFNYINSFDNKERLYRNLFVLSTYGKYDIHNINELLENDLKFSVISVTTHPINDIIFNTFNKDEKNEILNSLLYSSDHVMNKIFDREDISKNLISELKKYIITNKKNFTSEFIFNLFTEKEIQEYMLNRMNSEDYAFEMFLTNREKSIQHELIDKNLTSENIIINHKTKLIYNYNLVINQLKYFSGKLINLNIFLLDDDYNLLNLDERIDYIKKLETKKHYVLKNIEYAENEVKRNLFEYMKEKIGDYNNDDYAVIYREGVDSIIQIALEKELTKNEPIFESTNEFILKLNYYPKIKNIKNLLIKKNIEYLNTLTESIIDKKIDIRSLMLNPERGYDEEFLTNYFEKILESNVMVELSRNINVYDIKKFGDMFVSFFSKITDNGIKNSQKKILNIFSIGVPKFILGKFDNETKTEYINLLLTIIKKFGFEQFNDVIWDNIHYDMYPDFFSKILEDNIFIKPKKDIEDNFTAFQLNGFNEYKYNWGILYQIQTLYNGDVSDYEDILEPLIDAKNYRLYDFIFDKLNDDGKKYYITKQKSKKLTEKQKNYVSNTLSEQIFNINKLLLFIK